MTIPLNELTPDLILESNDASNWLKNAVRTAIYGRDLVDMINDVEVLLAVLKNVHTEDTIRVLNVHRITKLGLQSNDLYRTNS